MSPFSLIFGSYVLTVPNPLNSLCFGGKADPKPEGGKPGGKADPPGGGKADRGGGGIPGRGGGGKPGRGGGGIPGKAELGGGGIPGEGENYLFFLS